LLIASVTRDQAGHAQPAQVVGSPQDPEAGFPPVPAADFQLDLVAVYQLDLVAVFPRVLVAVCPRVRAGDYQQVLAVGYRLAQEEECRRAPAVDFLQALAIIGDACR